MSDEGIEDEASQNNFAVVRVNQELKNRSSLGVIFVTSAVPPRCRVVISGLRAPTWKSGRQIR